MFLLMNNQEPNYSFTKCDIFIFPFHNHKLIIQFIFKQNMSHEQTFGGGEDETIAANIFQFEEK